MKFKLVTGYSNYFACKNLFSTLKDDFFTDWFIIVPDRFTMVAEDLLFETLNIEATFNLNIMSLTRFVEKFTPSNKESQSMMKSILLIRDILEEEIDNLKFFKKADIMFCNEIYKNIMQIKATKLKSNDLIYNGNRSSLKNKIEDIALIYRKFEERTADFADSTDLLDNFSTEILKIDVPANSKVAFAGFDSFTQANLQVLNSCLKVFDEVVISLAATNKSNGNNYIFDKDIFGKLEFLAKENEIEIEVLSQLDNLNDFQTAIAKNLFSFNKKQMDSSQNLHISNSSSILEEVNYFASLIKYKVFNGERFKDFQLAVSDVNLYKETIEKVFTERDIPFYIDNSLDANSFLSELIVALLMLKIKGFLKEDVLFILNSPLFVFDKKEELISKVNESSDKKIFKLFAEICSNCTEIDWFVKNLRTCNTIEDFSKIILNFIDMIACNYNLFLQNLEKQNLIKEISILQQIPETLKDILLDIQCERSVDILEFCSIFKLAISLKEVSALPSFCDAVFVGDMTNSYFSEKNNLFVCGASGGDLPKVVFDNGLLSDEEIGIFKFKNRIEPTIKMINRKNRFKLFNNLLLAKQNLFISFINQDENGNENSKALFVNELMEIFNSKSNVSTSDLSYFGINKDFERFLFLTGGNKNFASLKLMSLLKNDDVPIDFVSSLQSVLQCDFQNLKLNRDKLFNKDNLLKFFKNNHFSVSQIEKFYDCPFKHFVDYGLRLKEKKSGEIKQNQIGLIVHKMLEIFINLFKNKEKNLEDKDILAFVDNNLKTIIDDICCGAEDDRIFFNYIKEDITKTLKRVVFELTNSCFVPLNTENYLVQEIEICDKKFEFVGSVDRIDVLDDDKKQFRIIDYKTGKIDGNMLSELYYGKKLQLFLYAKILKMKNKCNIAGIYYFNAKNSYDNENYILQGFTQKGKINKIDKRFEDLSFAESDIIPAKRKKDKLEYHSLTESQQKALEEYAFKLSKSAISYIINGKISACPTENSCKFCNYKSMCLYNKKNGFRKFSTKSINDFGAVEEAKDEL